MLFVNAKSCAKWNSNGVVGVRIQCCGSTQVELLMDHAVSNKLDELPQEFRFASKFCLKFEIQYFEVLFFVVFKSQFFREFSNQMVETKPLLSL